MDRWKDGWKNGWIDGQTLYYLGPFWLRPGVQLEKAKMVQEVVDYKMAEGKDNTKEKNDKKSKGKGAKDWKEDKVSMLIKPLKDRPCLWDVFIKKYPIREENTAQKGKADISRCNITSIKGKIDGLRAQYGCEMTKLNKTKSRQSTEGLYENKWAHYQNLTFLQPVMKQ